jgi:CVNH domain
LLSLSSLTKSAVAPAGILLFYGWVVGAAAAQSPSTYESTCRHIGIAGKTLFAECRRADGGYKRTNLLVAGIENVNGTLHFSSMYQASAFQDSCKDIVVAARTLSATCRRIDGGFARTSISIPGIENVDGDLRYRH